MANRRNSGGVRGSTNRRGEDLLIDESDDGMPDLSLRRIVTQRIQEANDEIVAASGTDNDNNHSTIRRTGTDATVPHANKKVAPATPAHKRAMTDEQIKAQEKEMQFGRSTTTGNAQPAPRPATSQAKPEPTDEQIKAQEKEMQLGRSNTIGDPQPKPPRTSNAPGTAIPSNSQRHRRQEEDLLMDESDGMPDMSLRRIVSQRIQEANDEIAATNSSSNNGQAVPRPATSQEKRQLTDEQIKAQEKEMQFGMKSSSHSAQTQTTQFGRTQTTGDAQPLSGPLGRTVTQGESPPRPPNHGRPAAAAAVGSLITSDENQQLAQTEFNVLNSTQIPLASAHGNDGDKKMPATNTTTTTTTTVLHADEQAKQDEKDLRDVVARRSVQANAEVAAAERDILRTAVATGSTRATHQRDSMAAANMVLEEKRQAQLEKQTTECGTIPPPEARRSSGADDAAAMPRGSTATEFSSDGTPLKSSLPPGSNRPGAYAGAPGEGYGRLQSARFNTLGAAYMEPSASDRMVTGDVPPPCLEEATEAEEAPENLHHLEAPCAVAPGDDFPDSTSQGDHTTKSQLELLVQKYKTYLIVGGVILLLVIIVAIAVPLATSGGGGDKGTESEEPAEETTLPPSDVDPSVIPGVPDSTWVAMFDKKSPQYLAYDWVVKDPNLGQYDDWQLRQRFALATFYYAMGGPRWELANWLDYELNECQWLTDPKTCHDDGNIKFLNITKQRGFKGTMPPELNLLTMLEGLDFSNNVLAGNLTGLFGNDFNHPTFQVFWCAKCRLSGTFPVAMTKMTNFRGLILRENDLTGSLPVEIGQLPFLQILELEENQFAGEIPSTIGNLQILEVLKMRENQFDSVPSEMWLLTGLVYLDLGENRFRQTIPTEIGALTKLQVLELDGNTFQGTIPSQVGGLTELFRLLLNRNELSGNIPDEIGLLTNVQWLWLIENQLGGPIPTSMGNMTSMITLEMKSNSLTSTIPSQLGLLVELQELDLDINELSGSIPSELGSLPQLTSLNVKSNPFLVEEVPEEFCAGPLWPLETDWCEGASCCSRR